MEPDVHIQIVRILQIQLAGDLEQTRNECQQEGEIRGMDFNAFCVHETLRSVLSKTALEGLLGLNCTR